MTQQPDRPLAVAPVRPYGTDSARMIEDYPEFGIMSFLPGGTFGARSKTEDGSFRPADLGRRPRRAGRQARPDPPAPGRDVMPAAVLPVSAVAGLTESLRAHLAELEAAGWSRLDASMSRPGIH